MNNKQANPRSGRLEREVAHYLATGESDPLGFAFPGKNTIECLTGYDCHLRKTLLDEVRRRERGRRQNQLPPDFHPTAWIRRKVQPMITGLFPAAERPVVLGVAEHSIVFLTRATGQRTIHETAYLSSAWTIANIYLYSLRAPRLGDSGSQIVGLSEETKCYVSLEYFAEKDPLADYVVHEVAHIFHNCKRETLGLPHSRSKEWLLDLAFAKRETFAYACEIYSRIMEQTHGKADRQALLTQYARGSKPSDDRVNHTELLDILADAVVARNGWKRILAGCAAPKYVPSSQKTIKIWNELEHLGPITSRKQAKKSAIKSSAEREAVGFVELVTLDPELSGLRTDYAQKPASERRVAAEWAYDESLATSLFGAAMARARADELPGPKWPPGFASLAIDPEYAPALLTVGCYEYGSGRRPQGMGLLFRLAQLPPDTVDWVDIIDKAGQFLMDSGDPGSTCRLYEEALKGRPDHQKFITGLGWALCRAGKQAEALPWLARAVANSPKDSLVLNDYGWALTELGRFDEAQPILETAVRLAPAGDDLPANNLARMLRLRKEQDRRPKAQ